MPLREIAESMASLGKATASIIVATCLLLTIAGAKTVRSAAEVLTLKRHNPCPTTGERRSACPGYQVAIASCQVANHGAPA